MNPEACAWTLVPFTTKTQRTPRLANRLPSRCALRLCGARASRKQAQALLALLQYDELGVTLAEQAGLALRAQLARRRRSGAS